MPEKPEQTTSTCMHSSAFQTVTGRKWQLLHSASLSPGYNTKKKNVCKYVLMRCSPCVTTSSSLPWERTFYSRLGIFTSAGTAHIQTSCSLFVQLCNCAPCEPFVVCDLTFIVAYTFWLYLGKVNPSLRGCTVPYVQDITKRAPSVPVWMRGMFVCVCVCVCECECVHIHLSMRAQSHPLMAHCFWKGMTLAPLPWMLGE